MERNKGIRVVDRDDSFSTNVGRSDTLRTLLYKMSISWGIQLNSPFTRTGSEQDCRT